MFKRLTSDPKTTIWGILSLTAYALKESPDLVSFLPETPRNYILGISALICAVMALSNIADKLTPAQKEAKEIKKEEDKELFKQEIKAELIGQTPAKIVIEKTVVKTPEGYEEVKFRKEKD